MKLRYAWADMPLIALAVVLLIPLMIHLVGIVMDFIADVWTFAP